MTIEEQLVHQMSSASRGLWGAINAMVPEAPPQLQEACAAMQGVTHHMSAVSFAVPWAMVGIAIGIVVAGVVAAVSIRVFRIGVSVLSGGGGA